MSEQNDRHPENDDALLKRLWKRATSSDKTAQAELLLRLQDTIFRFCCVQLSDRDAAQDATQETALRILKTLERYRHASKVKTWVLGIALNVCREHWQQNRRHSTFRDKEQVETIDRIENSTVLQTICRQETSNQILHLIQKLPPRQKEAIVLRYFEDLSVKETAKVMQVASGTVKATVAKAINQLRKKLTEDKIDGSD